MKMTVTRGHLNQGWYVFLNHNFCSCYAIQLHGFHKYKLGAFVNLVQAVINELRAKRSNLVKVIQDENGKKFYEDCSGRFIAL